MKLQYEYTECGCVAVSEWVIC